MTDNAAATPPEDSGEQADEQAETLTLGGRLRAARHAHELSIEKIADELRIEEHVLIALEEDRLSDINVAPVFIKGYIKQYGRLLRLDYDELRQAFREQVDGEDVSLKPNSSIQLRDERQITIWIIAALAVLLVGVALFVWWLGDEGLPSFGGGGSDIESVVPAQTRPASGAQDAGAGGSASARSSQPIALPATPAADTPASQSSTSPEPIALPPPSQAATDAASQDTTPAADVAPAGDSATAAADAPTGAQAPAAAAPDAAAPNDTTAAIAPPPPGSIPMRFVFSEQSWFEFEDAAGRRLFYDLAEPGRTLDFEALPPARVLIGNAAAVDITVASVPYAVPPGSLRGNVASFLIASAQD